jgi:hypothetical protein
MTYDEISELSRRSMPGAYEVQIFNSEPFLAYEIIVGKKRKNPNEGYTVIVLIGFLETGEWGKKRMKLYEVRMAEQIGVRALLKMISDKNREISKMKRGMGETIIGMKQLAMHL